MLKDQNGVCKICNKPETTVDKRNGKTIDLSIDHDHKTGVVRGLLCSKCNKGIGYFNDNPELIIVAANYIKQSTTKRF